MKYTEEQWEEEIRLNKFCEKHPNWFHSGCTLQCPKCHTFGFYGPKAGINNAKEITRKYRACKFCGFWQEAWGNVFDERGGEPYRCVIVHCDRCGEFDWIVPWTNKPRLCSRCHTEMKKVKWASDDPNHYFHKLNEQMIRVHNSKHIQ